MSDGRGMPLLSGPPPEYIANESSCRKCNKEFNILFARSRKCNHCGTLLGYLYCHSCTDYQALMPRREQSDLGATSGYDPIPVCAFCIEMLQITASGKGQLKQLPMAKLKKYAKAYNIDVAGIIEKDEFINKLVATRRPDGCLHPANESYYRKYSVPNRTNSRPRGFFTRAMDAMSGDRAPSSSTPPPPRPRAQPESQYSQYQPRQRTTSGPSRYAPHAGAGYPGTQYHQSQYTPPPRQSYPNQHYAPPPGAPPGYPPRHTQSAYPGNLNVPQAGSGRPRASSASSSPRATSPARPVVVPSIDELLQMTDGQIAALSIGSLKEILFKNHVTSRLVVEKGELVARVKTLVEDERAERERKAREEEEEREYEEEMRRIREEEARARARSSPSVEDAQSSELAQAEGVEGSAPIPVPGTSVSQDTPPLSSPPKTTTSPPPASTLTPKAQAMASRLERTGLCVICQDEEANIAIVDCGHLAMCRGCADLIMNSTRECPLCRTRIVTDSRLLRIFKS
ncbi:hypothetical protein C8Q74DRAFT_1208670 [Fomes fomentarius]|nr:hypothetical protein C8Q74DRAFT_1208670 [Fomes fomentarius]